MNEAIIALAEGIIAQGAQATFCISMSDREELEWLDAAQRYVDTGGMDGEDMAFLVAQAAEPVGYGMPDEDQHYSRSGR